MKEKTYNQQRASGRIILVLLFALSLIFHIPAAPTVTVISTGSGTIDYPAIYGDQIVWQEVRDWNTDIYLYNLTTGRETRITSDPAGQMAPRIYRNLIVWTDYRTALPTAYLYNITTGGPELQISDGTSDQTLPSVYGSHIVWSDDRSGVDNVFINGTSFGTESPLSFSTFQQSAPAIYDSHIIWNEDRGIGNQDIYLYNIDTHLETRITDDAADQVAGRIYGDRIVWEDYRNPRSEIFINGTSPGSEYSLTPNLPGIDSMTPAIYGPKVVWAQTNGSGYDIAMNDTSTGSLTPIAVSPTSLKQSPAIYIDPVYGDRIIWLDDRSGQNQIFLYSSTGPGTCPVAAFTSDFNAGSAPATVQFTDTTGTGPTHWFWDFGDGYNSTEQNPHHTYTTNDPFTVSLTAGNPWCRNKTTVSDFIVLGKPAASFTATPTYGIVPVTVHFTDASGGSPDTWNWSFGDGAWFNTTNPAEKDAEHLYSTAGTYTVNLTVSNTFGNDTKSRSGFITVFNGANKLANTTIDGISLSGCGGSSQVITVDTSLVTASLTPNTSVLDITPPSDSGFANIVVYALDGSGFATAGSIISGQVTGARLQTLEIAPTTFSPLTGPVSVNYSVDLPHYPCNASLNTQIWEGTTPGDREKFLQIALNSTYAHWLGALYTMKISKTGFPASGTAKLHMNANSSWVAEMGSRDQIHVERITDDGLFGEVLPTSYLSQDTVKNLDYFEADSPHGFSTFALSALSGSGNPLQLITLTISSHISPPQDNPSQETYSDINTAGAGKTAPPISTPPPTAAPTPVPPDPGTSARIYTNANGVVTQVTRLKSTDGRARITINEGITAKDAGSNPLAEMTVKALPSGNLPTVPSGSAVTFAGMAYEIGPDGATFSQPITLTFTLPQAQWGQDYSVKSFDKKSGTWLDLPTSFDASTGTVTVQFTHLCCFALFTQARVSPVTTPAATSTPLPLPAAPQVKDQPPASAVSTFTSMIGWVAELVMKNVLALIGFIALVIAIYFERQGHFPGSGR